MNLALLTNLSNFNKRIILFIADSFALLCSLFISFSMRLGELYFPNEETILVFIISPLLASIVFNISSFYNTVIRFFNLKSLLISMRIISIYSILWSLLAFSIVDSGIPRSVYLIHWLVSLIFLNSYRVIGRWILLEKNVSDKIYKRILIYGADFSGRNLLNMLSENKDYDVLGFIDDNPSLVNRKIEGKLVIHPNQVKEFIQWNSIHEIVLSSFNDSRANIFPLIKSLNGISIKFKKVPSLDRILENSINNIDFKSVSVEDLLGRDPVKPISGIFSNQISNKVIMITGAGGSIGSELCRQISKYKPELILLLDHSEFALYKIGQELSKRSPKIKLELILGSILEKDVVLNLAKKYRINTIFHAAAYKHVPLIEQNIFSGVHNNVFGTLNIVKESIKANIDSFVLVSTDKAVRPTNFMGASKRFTENIVQAISETSKTKFSIVRFGNVLGSSGSVIPLFRKQIENREAITVTHRKMSRYFMTIPEAAQLVIQAGAMKSKGEVFVLDMGKPVKIVNLAKNMIRLNGLELKTKRNPIGDIEIKYIGLRPGEKLYEELFYDKEKVTRTEHPRIYRASESFKNWIDLQDDINALKIGIDRKDIKKVTKALKNVVAGFNCS